MIFLTIGSHEPFDRLVRAVDEWARANPGEEVFGQIAHVAPEGYRPTHFPWVETMPPDEYRARFDAADIIVGHAGMGSIITALSTGKPLVMIPRRGHLGETRNDHQFATAQRFEGRAGIFVARDETGLASAIEAARAAAGGSAASSALSPFAQPQLIAAIRAVVLGGE